ncbi:hypothetical protein GVN20_01790 [Runella sp. CRIBMP]|uniref:hypothetical protein n=1 Tax=Runella sp. CRIBMP TaxID=2683261 RepID=UPI001412A155|nr:hypothetical protein [Runella sp. CRIBMP]NBB18074.1 hypothetical protein [Runella sp. CRIBMP]
MNVLDETIARIAALQSRGEEYFDEGLFPAQRTNRLIGYQRPDTTVFFTAVIVFTLQKLKPFLSTESQRLVDEIAQKGVQNYPKFQNKDGLKTYNFWKTTPSKHFPNGHVFRHFEHFRIPDDTDDTAMIYLTSAPTREEVLWLKEKLSLHANGTKQFIQNTYPEYRQLKGYSTWFGKNMYIEFDACVLANALYCIYEYNLPINQHDTDSLKYIQSVIETDRYLNKPFRCAHQYPRTVPIIYHVARLMGAFVISELEPIREKLIADTQCLLQKPLSILDEICLKTSLMRLGVKEVPEARLPVSNADFEGFYFFIAGLLTAYENPLLYRLAISPWFQMRWECEAHCWTLVAEYLALRQIG